MKPGVINNGEESLDKIDIFKKCMTDLKSTSYDDCNKQYMTECSMHAVDFDKVKELYFNEINRFVVRVNEIPKSNDALIEDNSGSFVFIEFKNGKINNKVLFEIRKKIYDSMLIFSDITERSISYTRNHMKYILVYNDEVNLEYGKAKEDDGNIEISCSESLNKLSQTFAKLGKKEHICYGLECFKDYIFKDVYTYTKQ